MRDQRFVTSLWLYSLHESVLVMVKLKHAIEYLPYDSHLRSFKTQHSNCITTIP